MVLVVIISMDINMNFNLEGNMHMKNSFIQKLTLMTVLFGGFPISTAKAAPISQEKLDRLFVLGVGATAFGVAGLLHQAVIRAAIPARGAIAEVPVVLREAPTCIPAIIGCVAVAAYGCWSDEIENFCANAYKRFTAQKTLIAATVVGFSAYSKVGQDNPLKAFCEELGRFTAIRGLLNLA